MVSISTELDEIDKIINISEKYDNIYCTVGIHPHSTNIDNQVDEGFLEKKSKNSNTYSFEFLIPLLQSSR